MKNFFSLVMAVTITLFSFSSFALPQNLPHHNSNDVDDWVKVLVQPNVTTFAADSSQLVAFGSGNPEISEVNSLGFGAVKMSAAGDDVHMIVPLPDNICVSCPIKVSVAWSTNDTTPATDTATWKVLYSATALGEAFSAATTALNTAIAADAISGVAYGLQETPQGVISANVLSRGDTLHILAELDAVSGLNPASDVVFLHGVYIEYVREKL